MKPTPHHYSALAIAAIIFCISTAGYVFIYYQINLQITQTASAEQLVQDQQRFTEQQQHIVASLTATAQDRASIDSFILSTDQTLPFIDVVEGLSSVAGAQVTITSISADASNVHAHISIRGPWTNTLRAMHLVENLPYSISISSISLTLQGNSLWDEEFDMISPISNT